MATMIANAGTHLTVRAWRSKALPPFVAVARTLRRRRRPWPAGSTA